jgi:hypothetical protein
MRRKGKWKPLNSKHHLHAHLQMCYVGHPPDHIQNSVLILLCFVLLCHITMRSSVLHVELLVTCGKLSMFRVVLLVSLESSRRWVEVHRVGLRLFGATVWKLLIIEPFSQWKLNKIENCIGIWECSWYCWKALGKSDLIKFIFKIFRAKVQKILIFGWILLLEIQTNCKKLGLEG